MKAILYPILLGIGLMCLAVELIPNIDKANLLYMGIFWTIFGGLNSWIDR